MTPPHPVLRRMSAIVLAGGAASRFGSDKTRAKLAGTSLVERAATPLVGLFWDTLVVTREEDGLEPLKAKGVRVVKDRFAQPHPMGGLLSGLETCEGESAFVCAADMPFIVPRLVEALCEAGAGYGAAVPRWQGALQPLCAVYSKKVAGVLRSMIAEKRLGLVDVFEIVPTRFLSEDEVRAADPDGRSFLDVDSPADLDRLSRGGAPDGA